MKINCLVVLSAMLALAGCDAPNATSTQATADAPEPAPTPTPNYTEVKKGVYYYTGAVSENDQKNGRAAASVVGFRYRGKNEDGDFVLSSDEGGTATCSDPCKIIHYSNGEAVAFSPDSIIGAAFSDAMNGFLQEGGHKTEN